MSDSPFSLPPGPERRAAMAEVGWNITPADFTDEENAAVETESARAGEIFARHTAAS